MTKAGGTCLRRRVRLRCRAEASTANAAGVMCSGLGDTFPSGAEIIFAILAGPGVAFSVITSKGLQCNGACWELVGW